MNFDLKAVTWDEDAMRRELGATIAGAMITRLPLAPGLRVLDLGCGTGLVGLPIGLITGKLIGIDLSPAMVARFQAKVAGRPGLTAMVRDLLRDPLPAESVDVAVSAMAFHHLPDPVAMLAALHRTVVPGGWLAVADLETEDGSFHSTEVVPHNGFDPADLATKATSVGWKNASCQRIHLVIKGGREYPVFLLVAHHEG